jgi:hypothetical protein
VTTAEATAVPVTPLRDDARDRCTVIARLRIPNADIYAIHPSTYERLLDILRGRGAAIEIERDQLLVAFSVDTQDVLAAQTEARPLLLDLAATLGLTEAAVMAVRAYRNVDLQEDAAEDDSLPMPPCVGVGEAAELLGVSKQRVHQLARTSSFPPPIFRLRATPVWREADVLRFANHRARRR